MVSIYCWIKTKVFKYKCRGHKDRRVLIQRKMVVDLFFLHLKSEKSANFEHKRRVAAKGKTENFGCFMVICRSPDSPNGESETKKHPSFSGKPWGRKQKSQSIWLAVIYLILTHHYSRREQLHKWSVSGTASQMTAGSGFTSKSQLAIPWRAASPREDVKLSLTAQWSEDFRFCPYGLRRDKCVFVIFFAQNLGKKNGVEGRTRTGDLLGHNQAL